MGAEKPGDNSTDAGEVRQSPKRIKKTIANEAFTELACHLNAIRQLMETTFNLFPLSSRSRRRVPTSLMVESGGVDFYWALTYPSACSKKK
jgi:hypothetical protein